MKTTWDENPFAWMWQAAAHPGMLLSVWFLLAVLSWTHQKYDVFGFTMFCIGVNAEKLLGERKP
jgi:ribose/xylose/arabinose/galactoside ABC-type transport system permease subunit